MRLKHWFYTVPLRLRSIFRRSQVEQELDEEISYHIERQIEENIAKGMKPEEARYAAVRAMGGVEQRKEECRDMRRVRLIEELAQDLRYGLRTLRKSPGFTVVAALSLALGIGANTAIFSLVDAVLLKTLPVKNPEQLVAIESFDQRGERNKIFSYPLFERLHDRSHVFTGVLAAEDDSNRVEMIGPDSSGRTEQAEMQLVSGEYFQVLGVNAVAGRLLTTADNQKPGAHPVAVLSYQIRARRRGQVGGKHLCRVKDRTDPRQPGTIGTARSVFQTPSNTDGGGRNGAAHRLRQRRQPAADARDYSPKRSGHQAGDWRGALQEGSPVPHGERIAGRRRRRARHAFRMVGWSSAAAYGLERFYPDPDRYHS